MLSSKCCTKLLCALLLLALLLSACDPQSVSDPTQPGTSGGPSLEPSAPAEDTVGWPIPTENRSGMTVLFGGRCPSSTSDGYYKIVGNRVDYFDAATKATVTLCAQPGCSHSGETCQAWLGGASSVAEYHGVIYAVRSGIMDTGDVDFIRKDLTSGKITVLAEWKADDTVSYTASLGLISDNMAVVYLRSKIKRGEEDLFRIDYVNSTWLFDLETGEKRELFPEESEGIELSVKAFSKSYAAVTCRLEEQDFLAQEEFYAQYGEDCSYGRYLVRSANYELRLYDADFSNYTVVTSTERGFVPYSEPGTTYGKELVYVEDDTIFLLNVDTGENRRLLSKENILGFYFLDHKIFFTTQEDSVLKTDSPMAFWCVDITDGELIQLKNGGRTDYMVHGITWEGQSFFLDSMNVYISESDFYAEELP